MRDAQSYILTYTNIHFYPLDPRPEEVNILDIAHALSLMTRYNGHCRKFYSVAEHSVRCTWAATDPVTPHELLAILLHDASEAYLADITRPVKRDPRFSFYVEAEQRLMGVIMEAFNLDVNAWLAPEVKRVDNVLLVTEGRDLFEPVPEWINQHKEKPMYAKINPWDAEMAERIFRRRFNEIISLC